MLQIINESLSLLLAVIIGALAYRYMTLFNRLLFLQLVVWIGFYVLSHAVTLYQEMKGIEKNNLLVINTGFFMEMLILTLTGYTFLKTKMGKSVLGISFVFFLILYIVQLSQNGYQVFADYAYILGSMIMAVMYSFVLYHYFKANPMHWKHTPEIWISLGILVYYACNVPYMSLVNYLNKEHLTLSAFLFHLINDVLANVRYLLLALGFWLIRRNALLLKPKSNAI